MKTAAKILISLPALFTAIISSGQSITDSANAPVASSPMVIKPGKPNDEMVLKVPLPKDRMAIMTDTGFITKNIHDNMVEVQLAKLGRDNSTSLTVKEVANVLIKDHATMLLGLQSIAKKQGLTEVIRMQKAPELPPLKGLKKSDFDAIWASAMLTMHAAKGRELEKFMHVTQNADIKALISRVLSGITLHKEMLLKIPGAKITREPNTVIQ